MIDTILNIISLGLKPLYEKHLEYYRIIEEFRNKLPRPQNEARKLTEEDKSKDTFLSTFQYMTVLDLSTHKVSLTEGDIDLFYNRLNNFDYRFMLFKDYYKRYTRNLNRFSPYAENKNFNLVMVQEVIKESPLRPLKPLEVLMFQLKWEIKPTSKIFQWFLERTKK